MKEQGKLVSKSIKSTQTDTTLRFTKTKRPPEQSSLLKKGGMRSSKGPKELIDIKGGWSYSNCSRCHMEKAVGGIFVGAEISWNQIGAEETATDRCHMGEAGAHKHHSTRVPHKNHLSKRLAKIQYLRDLSSLKNIHTRTKHSLGRCPNEEHICLQGIQQHDHGQRYLTCANSLAG